MNWKKYSQRGLLLFSFFLLPCSGSWATVTINHAGMELRKDEVLYLSARFELSINGRMEEALLKGIPLTFAVRIEVFQPRRYLWSKTVAVITQRYYLEYLPLSQQYLLKNLNSGAQNVLPTLAVALAVLGTIVDLPVIDSSLLIADESYRGRMKVMLEHDELPLPLHLQSYLSRDWSLESSWYSWPINF